MVKLLTFVIVITMACLMPGAFAADAPTIESLTATQSDKLTAIFTQQQRSMPGGCNSVKIMRARAIQILQPLMLNAQNQPATGQWRVRFAVEACPKRNDVPALRTAKFTVTPQGIALEAMAPGETLADEKLQTDVLKSLTLSGRVIMPKCTKAPVLTNTKVQVFPSTPRDRWVELWIARFCERDLAQSVEFLPGKSGTIFKMSLPKASAR